MVRERADESVVPNLAAGDPVGIVRYFRVR